MKSSSKQRRNIYAALARSSVEQVLAEHGGSQFSSFKQALTDVAVAALEMLDPPRDEFPPRPDETCHYYEAEISFFERVDVHVVCFASDQVSRIGTVPAP